MEYRVAMVAAFANATPDCLVSNARTLRRSEQTNAFDVQTPLELRLRFWRQTT